jgi:hypothetical protein
MGLASATHVALTGVLVVHTSLRHGPANDDTAE